MTKEIRLTVSAPVECTDEQYQEWVEYNTGYSASISLSNPLCEYDMDVIDIDIY